MYVGTIHAFCYNLLINNVEMFKDFSVLSDVRNYLFVNKHSSTCRIHELGLRTYADTYLYINCIEKMLSEYENREHFTNEQNYALKCYKDCLYSNQFFDFSFLIHEAIYQIRNNENVQNAIKNIKYLVVDEYQDIDDLQEELISLIENLGANICVVGDDDQTIYKFRGSNPKNIINFADKYKNVVTVNLEKNYRSTTNIITGAANLISYNTERLEKNMISNDKSSLSREIVIDDCYSEQEQYDKIATEIETLYQSGIKYKDMAILIRKRKYIDKIVKTLSGRNIPCSLNDTDTFFESEDYELFTSIFRYFKDKERSTLKVWKELTTKEKYREAFQYIRKVSNDEQIGKFEEIFSEVVSKINYLDKENEDYKRRKRYYEAFLNILRDFDVIYFDYSLTAKTHELVRFIQYGVEEQYSRTEIIKRDNIDEVQILTIHKSKGLEFDTVFIPNVNNGDMPGKPVGGRKFYHVLGGKFIDEKENYIDTIEDERKLFYVAITRAKDKLYLYTNKEKKESIFLKEIVNIGI